MLIPTSLWGTFLTLFPRSPILADHGSMMGLHVISHHPAASAQKPSGRLFARYSPHVPLSPSICPPLPLVACRWGSS